MGKRLKFGLVIIFFGSAVLLFMAFMPDGEGKVLTRLQQQGILPQAKNVAYHDSLNIRVMTFGDPEKPPLLLIHGSPGDWSAWEHIIANDSVRSSFYILAVDRAGYGETSVPAAASLKAQAEVVWQSLSVKKNIVVVGHSYGGAVVTQLLIDHPQAFKRAVLAAPTLSPEIMAPRWYNKVARWRPVNVLLSQDLQSSNIEMLGLPEGLKANEEKLASITTPIVYIQGERDVLVPGETVDYFKKHKQEGVEYIIIADMNHFIPWSDPQLIIRAILTN